jgi:hypothetical protein
LGGLDRLLKVLSRLKNFPRELEAQGDFISLNYIIFEGLNTTDPHLPEKMSVRVGMA